MSGTRTAAVLGAYGLIGSACVRELKDRGFDVLGVGRSLKAGRRSDPGIRWLARDIVRTSASEWRRDLAGADVVVNASGALQDGWRDRLAGIHETALAELIDALSGSKTRFIQISAAGVSQAASTEFFRSKMRGDTLLMHSPLDWIVLRPTLVISPQAYGGTALLRAAAGAPLVGLQILADVPVQTVAVGDVAAAIGQAACGEIPSRTVADLTETAHRPLAGVVEMLRAWQGFAPWRWTLRIPLFLVWPIGKFGDLLGWLGWRPPLRSTTLQVLQDGVRGDPQAWRDAGGAPCRSLPRTLAELPSTVQERWFARLYLLLPVLIATLAVFWFLSGVIGLANRDLAEHLLMARGLPETWARLTVAGGALVDIALGMAVILRPLARGAALAMVAVSLAYLIGATLLAGDLWADPLGPLLKIFPGTVLALIAASILDER